MKNFNKYITLNFLSICGYVFFIFAIVTILFLLPNALHKDTVFYESFPGALGDLVVQVGMIVLDFALVELLAIFLSLFEFCIYKIKKMLPVLKIADKLYYTHFRYFVIGIVLSLLPILIVIYIFLSP